MAKLYYRYGTVGSAKTLNLLAVAHTYRQQGKEILLLKPALDTRFGQENIRSRAGLEKSADLLLDRTTHLLDLATDGVACILVDEVQFLQPFQIEELRQITLQRDVPAICYGLRTDFRTRLFPGSQRLMELADSIEEIKMTCAFCTKKAVFSLKHSSGKATIGGPTVDLGAEEKYFPTCARCFQKQLHEANVVFEQWAVEEPASVVV